MGTMARSMTGSILGWRRFVAVWMLAAGMVLAFGTGPSMAESRAHVYLLRGLLNVFSLGMDTLAEELNRHGVYATVHNHTEWQSLADSAAAKYKAGTEGPIIIIGHSLGADAVMEMSAYLGQKGVPVALAVPFDGTQSFAASGNIGRVVNLTQRDYAFMRKGAAFKGTLVNVDVRSDPSIDHLNIDKSPRLHARVISEVLSVVGSHRMPAPGTTVPRPTQVNSPSGNEPSAPAAPAKPEVTPTPAAPAPGKTGSGASNTMALKPVADSGTPVIALPERSVPRSDAPARKPAAPASTAAQVPN
jgi:hypothetical protein